MTPAPVAPVAPVAPAGPPPKDLTDQMSDHVVTYSKKLAPWSAPWWVALLQGIFALGLGIALMVWPTEATLLLGQLLALYLLVSGVFEVIEGLRNPRTTTAANISFYKGIVGAVIGGLLLLLIFMQAVSASTGFILLGIGLLVYGAVGLFLGFQRHSGNGKLLSLIAAALFVILGILSIWFQDAGVMDVWVAWTLVILGAGLIVLAFMRRSNAKKAAAAA